MATSLETVAQGQQAEAEFKQYKQDVKDLPKVPSWFEEAYTFYAGALALRPNIRLLEVLLSGSTKVHDKHLETGIEIFREHLSKLQAAYHNEIQDLDENGFYFLLAGNFIDCLLRYFKTVPQAVQIKMAMALADKVAMGCNKPKTVFVSEKFYCLLFSLSKYIKCGNYCKAVMVILLDPVMRAYIGKESEYKLELSFDLYDEASHFKSAMNVITQYVEYFQKMQEKDSLLVYGYIRNIENKNKKQSIMPEEIKKEIMNYYFPSFKL